MGDALPRRRRQRLGDLAADAKHLWHGKRAPGHECLERLAVQQLHDEVRRVAFAADIEQGADVGMREPGNRARLTVEPLSRVARHRHGGRQDFHRHEPIQPRVARLVNLPHAAGAECCEHFVWTEPGAGSQTHADAAL